MMKFIFLVHLMTTWVLVGLIWTIQQVHYPLFDLVGIDAFPQYETAHMMRILPLVFPLMTIELITAFLLVFRPMPNSPSFIWWIGLALVLIIWVSTALINVPQHSRLSAEFDTVTHQALVTTNWIRTILWTARGGLLAWVLWNHVRFN